MTVNTIEKYTTGKQLELLEQVSITPFEEKLNAINLLPFKATGVEILQINLGKMCNQVCTHCHVDAGPDRKEIMTKKIMQECLELAKHEGIHTIDLTGGAPEMNPEFRWFVKELAQLGKKVIVRSNLTILTYKNYKDIPEFFKEHNVTVVSSLPCYTKDNVDKQRGNGVFERSINALKELNRIGYGIEGTGLELNLVFNPGGPSLPPDQNALQEDYKRELKEYFDLDFNTLYTITNLPISRFLEFLIRTERYEEYMQKLVDAFNPDAAKEVMCRNTLSIGWDGYIYDCDFNQMLELPVRPENARHVSDVSLESLLNREIIVNQHCYGCTAGAGSSCQGSIV